MVSLKIIHMGYYKKQEKCKRGHPMAAPNLIVLKDKRMCKACHVARIAKYRETERGSRGYVLFKKRVRLRTQIKTRLLRLEREGDEEKRLLIKAEITRLEAEVEKNLMRNQK